MATDKEKQETLAGRVLPKGVVRRMKLSLVAVLVTLLLLCAQLFRLQIVDGDGLQSQAVAQQLSDVSISPNRGQIYDANMSVLALTREVCTVIMSPSNIKTEVTRQKIINDLTVMLDVDRTKLTEQVYDTQSQYKVVKSKIEKSLGETFKAWVDENGYNGIFRLVADYKREYPLKSLLSNVLGFVSADNRALEGLEKKYDDVLSGVAGRMVVSQNPSGDELPNSLQYEYTVDARDGNHLVLTVDQYIQQVTEKYLNDAVTEFKAANRGCAIVMEVDTGAILAMATKGDYDPNDYLTIADPTVAEQLALLSGDEQSKALTEARNAQYRNKALDFYEPGSVFKTFTASMGLEEGVVTETSPFYCGGSFTILDRTMKCWIHPRGHGQQTFVQAIANSCNPAFMTLGTRLGTEVFSKYYVGFGFTSKTGVDLLGEPSVTAGLYHSADSMSPVDVAASSIGQTFKVTPLQMVTALSAVANGGKLMQPYIVQKIIDSDGNVIRNTAPIVRRQVVSESTSERVCRMLENAVSSGSIKNAYISGYRVGGKTGTAEKTETKSEKDNDRNVEVIASFGGLAPADNPKVAILVMVDEPKYLKSGGGVAAPMAKKIFKDILPYLGVEPNYSAAEIASLDRSVPNVVGMNLSETATKLKSSTLTYRIVGRGQTVARQMPAAGATIPKGGTVWLYTDTTEQQMTTVPNFEGRTVAQVNQAANTAGINVLLSGISTASGTATATKQSASPGQSVPKGTVVTVEFTYADRIY